MNKILKLYQDNRNIVINSAGAFFIKGGALIVNVLSLPAYIQFFNNQTVLGVWYTVVSVLNWMLVFDLGLGNGLRNRLPKALVNNDEEGIRGLITTTYVSMSIFVALLMVISLCILPRLEWNIILNISESVITKEMLLKCITIVIVGIYIQFIVKIICSILFALQKSMIVNLLTLITSIVILIGLYVIPSVDLYNNLMNMAWLNVIASVLPYIIATFIVFNWDLKDYRPRITDFDISLFKDIFGVGISLLLLQIVFMVISSTNEYLVSWLTEPEYVVQYQAYDKIFKLGVSVLAIALTPVWSSVTKAQAQKNYVWIIKIYKFFCVVSLIGAGIELLLVPFLQPIMNIWLGNNAFKTDMLIGFLCALSSILFMFHSVNTSIGNGISYFKVQIIFMGLAAIIDIPLSILFVRLLGGWWGIILANILALLPYEIIAPIATINKLKMYNRMETENNGNS